MRTLAHNLDISVATVHHWKHQENSSDRSCRPHTIHYALDDDEESLMLWLRQKGDLSLDDLFDLAAPLMPHLRRSSLHRLLKRNGCSRLPKKEQQPTGEVGTFKEYGPGFIHIDCFYLPKLDGQKYYCFVAIDRATRLLYLSVYQNRDGAAASHFLRRCLEYFPFKIEKILTDNGREFTLNGFKNRYGTTKKVSFFTQICHDNAIEHRQTRPYTPKTNGMVERANGLVKEGTTKVHLYQNVGEMKDDLHRWFVFYNFDRIHRQIGRITPYQAVCQWHQKHPELFHKDPTELLAYRSQPDGT
jgi:transposase InsO family protein